MLNKPFTVLGLTEPNNASLADSFQGGSKRLTIPPPAEVRNTDTMPVDADEPTRNTEPVAPELLSTKSVIYTLKPPPGAATKVTLDDVDAVTHLGPLDADATADGLTFRLTMPTIVAVADIAFTVPILLVPVAKTTEGIDEMFIVPWTVTDAEILLIVPILFVPVASTTAAEILFIVPILFAPAAMTTPAEMLLIVPILFVPVAKTTAGIDEMFIVPWTVTDAEILLIVPILLVPVVNTTDGSADMFILLVTETFCVPDGMFRVINPPSVPTGPDDITVANVALPIESPITIRWRITDTPPTDKLEPSTRLPVDCAGT